MATITIPIVLDASASATIFAEAQPVTDASYVFSMNSSALSAADLSNFLQYIDQDSGETLFTYNSTAKTSVEDNLHSDICNQDLTYVSADSNDFPNHTGAIANAPLGEMLVKYIASVLFGHPEAQAPIKNDSSIINAVQNTSNIHGQFVNELIADLSANAESVSGGRSNDVVLSIFEQLVAHSATEDASGGDQVDSNRFGDMSHTDGYRGIPFLAGDTIIFLINMTGSITTDDQNSVGANYTASSVPSIQSLFGDNPDLAGVSKDQLVPKIWELRITLA